jgi:hypothetical protein
LPLYTFLVVRDNIRANNIIEGAVLEQQRIAAIETNMEAESTSRTYNVVEGAFRA